MYKQFFADMEFTALPIFALGLFIAIFLLMALRTFVFKSVRDFEPQSLMPLNDGNAVREVKP